MCDFGRGPDLVLIFDKESIQNVKPVEEHHDQVKTNDFKAYHSL